MEYTPWDEAPSGGIGQTTLNYTGQRRDGTGLVFYDAPAVTVEAPSNWGIVSLRERMGVEPTGDARHAAHSF